MPRLALSVLALVFVATCATSNAGIAVLDSYPPDVSATTQVAWYDVHGTTAAEVETDMRNHGPTDGIAHVLAETWSPIRFSYHVRQTSVVCGVEDARAFVQARVVMPRWVAPPNAEPGLVERWDSFQQSLIRHELGHKEIAGRNAEDLVNRLNALASPCMTFNRDVYQLINAIVAREQKEQREYDVNTIEILSQISLLHPVVDPVPLPTRAAPPAPVAPTAPGSAPSPAAAPQSELTKVAAKAARVTAHPDTINLGVGSVLSLDVFRLTVYDSSGTALTDLLDGNYDIRLPPCQFMSGSGREYRGTAAGTCEMDLLFPARFWTRPDSAPSARVTIRFTR